MPVVAFDRAVFVCEFSGACVLGVENTRVRPRVWDHLRCKPGCRWVVACCVGVLGHLLGWWVAVGNQFSVSHRKMIWYE